MKEKQSKKSKLLMDAEDINLEELLEQFPGHIYWKDKNGVCIGSNTNNWRDFGCKSLADFKGKTDYDLFPKHEADFLRTIDNEVMHSGITKIAEEELTLANGEKILYLSHKTPLKNKYGQIVGILGVSVDITQAKHETIEQLRMLENIIALLPGNIYWKNKKGIIIGCNEGMAKYFDFKSRDKLIGCTDFDILDHTQAESVRKADIKVMNSKEPQTIEEISELSNKEIKTFLSRKEPLFDTAGNVIGLAGISIDITDRKRAEEALRIAKEEAVAANQAKSKFLDNMRHDLKTPFNGILGIAQALEVTEKDPERKKHLSYVTHSARVLLNHLNEIFEIIRTENGQLPLAKKQFDLHKVIQEVIDMMTPFSRDKGIELTVTYDKTLPRYLIGDAIRTQRILMNLVSNSLKYTKKGYVKLDVRIAKKENNRIIVRFIIEDSGIGIPNDKIASIFDQFSRLTPSNQNLYPGQGLGLRIVKLFLNELGGEIHLTSEVDKGSTFKILVPYELTLLDCPEDQI